MLQRRDRTGFALKALPCLVDRSDLRREHLDGHVAMETRVVRAIHLAHAPGADGRDDFVRTEPCPDWKCHALVDGNRGGRADCTQAGESPSKIAAALRSR